MDLGALIGRRQESYTYNSQKNDETITARK